ncbi:MAG: NAD(P)/FAD-dependent oxidoreductase [Vulcanococcus sp.]
MSERVDAAGLVPAALECEVLIAGAGPSGSDLARRLAEAGRSVLLVDSLRDLRQAAFSSAALPWSAVERHGFPEEVVAARWSHWLLIGPGSDRRAWGAAAAERQGSAAAAAAPLGAVLDFGALRQWLAERARQAGAVVQLGWRAERLEAPQPSSTEVLTPLRGPGGQRQLVRSRFVVDATGQTRALLGEPPGAHDSLVTGSGVEWLLQLDPSRWRPWADRLTFLMGSDWVPQGYGWVFPMTPGLLKVGVCRLRDAGRCQAPLHGLLQTVLQRLDLGAVQVLDRHGGLIRSTIRRREPHRRGALLGLGDAVSTANLLGGEGIRHALTSSEVLAPLLLNALDGRAATLDRYAPRLRRRLGWRWSLSGRLARRTWLGLDGASADARLRRLLSGLEAGATADDLSALLFDYRFERYGLKALPYLIGWR